MTRRTRRVLNPLRMNVSFVECMSTVNDNLYSKLEASETRINKDLRDKAELLAKTDEDIDAR